MRKIFTVVALVFGLGAWSCGGNTVGHSADDNSGLPDNVAGDDGLPDAAGDDLPLESLENDMTAADLGVTDSVDNDESNTDTPDTRNAPFMEISNDELDFGSIAANTSVSRDVTITNAGLTDLVVTFVLPVEGDTLGQLSTATEFPLTVAAGNSQVVTMRLVNNGGLKGNVTLSMTVLSNSPGQEQSSIAISASLHDVRRPCEPSLLPDLLDFGSQVVGTTATRSFSLTNDGLGYCDFQSAWLVACDCSAADCVCPGPDDQTSPDSFTLVTNMPPTNTAIYQNSPLSLEVRYEPVAIDAGSGTSRRDAAVLYVRVRDNMSQTVTVLPVADSMTDTPAPNLSGTAILSN